MHYSSPETRASLILRLQDAADVAAWNSFESIYAPVVKRIAHGQGLQPADADNVVQEVLLRVAKSVGDWVERADRGPFRAWILRIAHNETIRLLSRPATKTFATVTESHLAQLPKVAADDISSQLDLEYRRELFLWAAERVRQEVAELTWQAFWLTQVEGLSVLQAAERLGVKSGNIYFGRSRVMNRLKLAVQQFEEV